MPGVEKICGNCENWDSRPEEGMDPHTGYCVVLDRLTSREYSSEHFVPRSPVDHEAYMRDISEEDLEGLDDLEFPDN